MMYLPTKHISEVLLHKSVKLALVSPSLMGKAHESY